VSVCRINGDGKTRYSYRRRFYKLVPFAVVKEKNRSRIETGNQQENHGDGQTEGSVALLTPTSVDLIILVLKDEAIQ
jgi:hypothetical protein